MTDNTKPLDNLLRVLIYAEQSLLSAGIELDDNKPLTVAEYPSPEQFFHDVFERASRIAAELEQTSTGLISRPERKRDDFHFY